MEQRHKWLKWISVVIVFLVFAFVLGVPVVFADEMQPADRVSEAGAPVLTVPADSQEIQPEPAPISETASDFNFEPNPKPISAPTAPPRAPASPSVNPASVLIPAAASVTSASAAAMPIVDDLLTAIALAAPETEN